MYGALLTAEEQRRITSLKSQQRSVLNGLMVNRAKYTTYSRHFTSARVLREIAARLQERLLPGDTFVDCGSGLGRLSGFWPRLDWLLASGFGLALAWPGLGLHGLGKSC